MLGGWWNHYFFVSVLGWTSRLDDKWENVNCPIVYFCFPILGFSVSLNSKVHLLHKLWNDHIASLLRRWREIIFWNEAPLLFVFVEGCSYQSHQNPSHSCQSLNNNIKNSPGPQDRRLQKTARKNWMNEWINEWMNYPRVWLFKMETAYGARMGRKKGEKNLSRSYLSLIKW